MSRDMGSLLQSSPYKLTLSKLIGKSMARTENNFRFLTWVTDETLLCQLEGDLGEISPGRVKPAPDVPNTVQILAYVSSFSYF